MTIQEYIKQGNEWIDLKGVPVCERDSEGIAFIHNKFFEGKELEFQNKVISSLMELCPDSEWCWRVYGVILLMQTWWNGSGLNFGRL